jgi:DNA-binding protein YbaB
MADEEFDRPVCAKSRDNMPAATTEAANHELTIERTASIVTIKLGCANEYAAIELYEHLIASVKAGNLKLDITATGRQRP